MDLDLDLVGRLWISLHPFCVLPPRVESRGYGSGLFCVDGLCWDSCIGLDRRRLWIRGGLL